MTTPTEPKPEPAPDDPNAPRPPQGDDKRSNVRDYSKLAEEQERKNRRPEERDE